MTDMDLKQSCNSHEINVRMLSALFYITPSDKYMQSKGAKVPCARDGGCSNSLIIKFDKISTGKCIYLHKIYMWYS